MSSATKLSKANEHLTRALDRARTNARDNNEDLIRKGSGLASAFVLGSLKKSGKLASLPTIPGVPRIVTVALLANGAGMIAPRGKMKLALDGLGESSLAIAAYEWGQGGEVAGVGETDVGSVEGRRKRTRRELGATQERVRELEAQLAAEVRKQLGAQSNERGALDEYIELPV